MNLREEQKNSKLLPDMYWFTHIDNLPERSIGVSLKYPTRFFPGFTVINSQITMNWRNSLNSSVGNLIILLVSTRITS